jgi:uncharacterized protein (DUF849 family)
MGTEIVVAAFWTGQWVNPDVRPFGKNGHRAVEEEPSMDPVMIEVALNESVSKSVNPTVPYSADEVVADAMACVEAGASILHFHARDGETGEQRWHDIEYYRTVFALLQKECDALMYPTQPGTSLEAHSHVIELADDPSVNLELATVDVFPVRPLAPQQPDPMVQVLTELRQRGIACSIGLRDVGDTRNLETYRSLGLLDEYTVLKLIFNESNFWGPEPSARAILMYLDSVPAGIAVRWFAQVSRGRPDSTCLRRMSMLAAGMGGHIRVGVGDHPTLDGRTAVTNVDHVKMATEMAHAAGRAVATVTEARAMMGASS